MAYDFSHIKTRLEEVENWLQKELASIHTGRAAPSLLDKVTVEAYGAKSPLQHLASIGIEDPRTLRVTPYDKSQNKEIEKAIERADMGVSVSVDDAGLRVFFPELTAERRDTFAKVVKERLEDAHISVKREREETWSDIQKKEKDGELSEDEKHRYKDELQKMVDDTNARLKEMAEKKEEEIRS